MSDIKIGTENCKLQGLKTLFFEKDGKKQYVHSKYDPIEEAKEWAKATKKENPKTTYLIFGGGLLYHIKELIDLTDELSNVVVVEPDIEVYNIVKCTELFKELSKNSQFTYFAYGEIEDFYTNLFGLLSNKNYKNITFAAINPYDNYFNEYHEGFIKAIKSHLNSQEIDMNTRNTFIVEHMDNFFSNLLHFKDSKFIMDFRDIFEGQKAVVVSAGPSLEKNIDQLKGCEDRLIIVAGGRTLKPLLNRGIRPHFVVSVDPTIKNFQLFEDALESDVPLVLPFLNNKEIAKQYKGNKIFLNNTGIGGFDSYFFDRHVDTLSVSGTVATMQFSFAEYLGCDEIAFIGQDLAYTGGKLHADSAASKGSDNNSVSTENLIKVKGNNEDFVYTDIVFNDYLLALGQIIEEATEVKSFNCTEGGAYIKGTEVITLKDFLENHTEPGNDFNKKINEILSSNKNHDRTNEIIDKINGLKTISLTVLKYAKEAQNITEKTIKNKNETEKDTKKLKKLDNKINRIANKFEISSHIAGDMMDAVGNVWIDETKEYSEQMQDIRKLNRTFYLMVQAVYLSLQKFIDRAFEEYYRENDLKDKAEAKK